MSARLEFYIEHVQDHAPYHSARHFRPPPAPAVSRRPRERAYARSRSTPPSVRFENTIVLPHSTNRELRIWLAQFSLGRIPLHFVSLCYHVGVTGKDRIKLLERNGWILDRVKGSHYQMAKGDASVTVPVHGTTDLAKGTVSKILKDAGLR